MLLIGCRRWSAQPGAGDTETEATGDEIYQQYEMLWPEGRVGEGYKF